MKDLIARAARGDLEAFTELIRPRQAALRAFCVRLLPDGDAADDLAQEVFLAAFQSLRSFDPSRDFDTWIRGIARNKVRMALRHESVRRDALDRVLRREAENRLVREPERSEGLLDALKGCVQGLRDRIRQLLSLFYLEHVPVREAAQMLGMSEGAFYTTLTRTRQSLRRCVEQKMGER